MPEVVPQQSPVDLKVWLVEGRKFALLDVREPDERDYAAITVGEAVVDLHVPLGELTGRLAEVQDAVGELPLVVYCHHGQRSMVAATWLSRQGMGKIQNLDGGIDGWSTRVDREVRRY